MSRLLGIDLGERRIGLAVADGDGSPARPLDTISRAATPADDATTIGRIVERLEVGGLVVGLPYEASGDVGAQARRTLDWVDAMRRLIDLPIVLRDERLTSHVAETRLGPPKRGRSGGPPSRVTRIAHRARIDREAAAIILQDELDARAATQRPERTGESAT